MRRLPLDLDQIPYVQRETTHGKALPLRCFRDFIYYALLYYQPAKYAEITPGNLESTVFDCKIPTSLIWTMLHMKQSLRLLKDERLELWVNNRPVSGYWSLMYSLMMPVYHDPDDVITLAEQCVTRGTVFGIDLSIKYFGLLDHVLFVYGFDQDNLYVLDTHVVSGIDYSRVPDTTAFLMKLPKAEVQKRTALFSRTWSVVPRETC